MKIGICELAYIPMRVGRSHQSEMVNQVIFGEMFEILIQYENWTKIRLFHDAYEGWVENTSYTRLENTDNIDTEYYNKKQFCSNSCGSVFQNQTQHFNIPLGAMLHTEYNSGNSFSIGKNIYQINNCMAENRQHTLRNIIVDNALKLLNTPYLWGGRTQWGIDCSGFIQLMFRLIGMNIKRDASQQIELGKTLYFVSEAQKGDLAFFQNEEGAICHVGILISNTEIIHASKYVRIDKIDHQGIYNCQTKQYSHNLRVIKSVL